jgi:hypothetical protein
MSRRVTAGERDSLIAAYLACRTWRAESGAIVGEHAGWRVWMSDKSGVETGFATCPDMDVIVELTPPVIRAWIDRVRTRFLKN